MDHTEIEKIFRIVDLIRTETNKVIVGKDHEVCCLISAVLASGHVLIEDVPGTGKTVLAQAMAKACGLSFNRIQFTPDVMASDVTGFNIYNRKTESFEFRPGIVMTNLLLADEINRAAPRTQSSLLEAMEERQVSVDGVTMSLPEPFLVIATQNPIGSVGTYPLPEAQLDRFSMILRMGYPTREQEIEILRARKTANPLSEVKAVANPEIIKALTAFTERVKVSEKIENYIVDIVSATRGYRDLTLGASPRASLILMKLSRAVAVINHRTYVTPDDVVLIAPVALSHRVKLSRDAVGRGLNAQSVIKGIISSVQIPFDTAEI